MVLNSRGRNHTFPSVLFANAAAFSSDPVFNRSLYPSHQRVTPRIILSKEKPCIYLEVQLFFIPFISSTSSFCFLFSSFILYESGFISFCFKSAVNCPILSSYFVGSIESFVFSIFSNTSPFLFFFSFFSTFLSQKLTLTLSPLIE